MSIKNFLRLALLTIIVCLSTYSYSQDCSHVGGNVTDYFTADEFTGNYESAAVWCTLIPSTNGSVNQTLNIYGTITRTGDLDAETTHVYDTLYVSANVINDGANGFIVHGNGYVEIFGDLISSKALNVQADATLIVHGSVTISNAGANISGNMIVLGNINITSSEVTSSGNLIVGGDFTHNASGGLTSPAGNSNIYILDPDAILSSPNYGPIHNRHIGDYQDLRDNESADLVALVDRLMGIPTPVELVSFSAAYVDKTVKLKWSTATELNNDYFCVERSSDGEHFTKIAQIQGNGTSHAIIHYEYSDRSPLFGLAYYRLKQVDYDGTTDYSNVISVKNSMIPDDLLNPKIYPNPYTSNALTIEMPYTAENTTISVDIKDLNGQLVYSDKLEKADGQFIIQDANLSSLLPGLYVINIKLGTEQFIQKLQVL